MSPLGLKLKSFHSYDDEGNDLPKVSRPKPTDPDSYTSKGQPVDALPLKKKSQARNLQLALLMS